MSAQPRNEEAPPPRSRRLTLKEAATKVGVSTATIRRRIKDGSLRAYQTMGKFGSQWVISPLDLESVTFVPGESLLDFDEPDEADEPGGPSPETPPTQPPSNGEFSEVVDELSSAAEPGRTVSIVPQGPSLEQQALHQAGYWKGRWEEARERVMELENQIHSFPPLAQLSADAEASRQAEQQALLEAERLQAQLQQLTEHNCRLQHSLQLSETAVAELKRPWWQRLFRA